jgi:hypothetical protein
LLGNTLLFTFIVIEWIVCTFYRTDGFRVWLKRELQEYHKKYKIIASYEVRGL